MAEVVNRYLRRMQLRWAEAGGQACERALEPEHGSEKEQNRQGAAATPRRSMCWETGWQTALWGVLCTYESSQVPLS